MTHLKSSELRAKKHKEALERKAAYDKLTIQQKITRAKGRSGKSAREITRLTAKLGGK